MFDGVNVKLDRVHVLNNIYDQSVSNSNFNPSMDK